jgi:Ca2+:H+ antiporter
MQRSSSLEMTDTAGVAQSSTNGDVHVIRAKGRCSPCGKIGFLGATKLLLIGTKGERPWFNLFLIFIPLCLIGSLAQWPPGVVFALSLLAMLPLAERLGFCTEELSEHVSDTVAGLMNASMGNAPELIIALFAMEKGLYRVVQLSLVGSVLSNLLLVLGTSLWLGGVYHREQSFNNDLSATTESLLHTTCLMVFLPTMLRFTNLEEVNCDSQLLLSRIASLFMLFLYIAYLIFQLKTHSYLFEDDPEGKEIKRASLVNRTLRRASSVDLIEVSGKRSSESKTAESKQDTPEPPPKEEAEAEIQIEAINVVPEEDELHFSMIGSIIGLACIAVVVAFVSDILVGSIEGAADTWGISSTFVAVILVPVAGNAAEHTSAVIFATRNRLNVTIGVALGSSVQVFGFLVPFLVLVGWIGGYPMDLQFGVFENFSLLLAVLASASILNAGKSYWISGCVLVCGYGMVAAGYAVHKEDLAGQCY